MLNDTYDPNTDPNVNPNWFDWGTTPTPSSPGYNDGGGFDWGDTVVGPSFGLASQIVQAFGHHPSQQIGGAGTQGIGGGYNPSSILQAGSSYNRGATVYPGGTVVPGASNLQGGLGVDNTLNSLTNIVQRNPLLIFGGIAVILLWKSGRK